MSAPNPLKIPSFLQQLQWATDPVRYMEKAAQQYPDIFTAQSVQWEDNFVLVNHPEGVKEILTNERQKFVGLKKLSRNLLTDYSIFDLEGDPHRERRKLLMPSFHGAQMQKYGELIVQITEKIWSQLPRDKTFSSHTATQNISLQLILKIIFGVQEGNESQQVAKIIMDFEDTSKSPLWHFTIYFPFLQKDLGAWSPWNKFFRSRDKVDQLIYGQIAERRQQKDENRIDILSLLMSAQDEAGNSMTDQELRDELAALLFAGYETTASAMAWGLYWIHKHSEVREKLLQELDTLGDSPDPMSIFRLPYLTAVCNETLRISPVAIVTFPRRVQEPVQLLGYSLEPGTIVAGCIYLTHNRQDLYPQPKQFKPERFLERQFYPYEFMPFGGGARRCLGEALAMLEMKLVLATILSRYHMALADSQPEVPKRRGVILAPGGGVKMVITGKRSQPNKIDS